ncbi:MAG: DUF4398 domain-containing protein [Verrucomicrobiota bacterium]
MTLRTWLPAVALLLGGACATDAASTTKAENSMAAIRAAEEVGATHSPTAALHLQLAKEQFEYARTMTHPDSRDRAERLRMRAQADAELSLALARSENEKAEATSAIEKLKMLNQSAPQ